jgi:hypothetical protein
MAAILLAVTACGSTASSDSAVTASFESSSRPAETTSTAMAVGTTYEMADDDSLVGEAAETEDGSDETTERKLVYTGSMDLETKEFDESLAEILALVGENGGYVSSQEVSGASMRYQGSSYERTATLTVRIPSADFERVMTDVAGICNMTSQSMWVEDISDTYYDTQAHLDTLKLQEERLLAILEQATQLDDIITIESSLSDVRYQIESITAKLRRMDNRVDYSTLTLYLREVVEYSEQKTTVTFGERLAAAAKRGGAKISNFFQGLALWIVEDLPVTLLWIVLIGAVVFIAVKVIRFLFPKHSSGEKKERRHLFRKKTGEVTPDEQEKQE